MQCVLMPYRNDKQKLNICTFPSLVHIGVFCVLHRIDMGKNYEIRKPTVCRHVSLIWRYRKSLVNIAFYYFWINIYTLVAQLVLYGTVAFNIFFLQCHTETLWPPKHITRWVVLMIQLGKFVGGWLTPTTYIQLAGAGSIFYLYYSRYLPSNFCIWSLNLIVPCTR